MKKGCKIDMAEEQLPVEWKQFVAMKLVLLEENLKHFQGDCTGHLGSLRGIVDSILTRLNNGLSNRVSLLEKTADDAVGCLDGLRISMVRLNEDVIVLREALNPLKEMRGFVLKLFGGLLLALVLSFIGSVRIGQDAAQDLRRQNDLLKQQVETLQQQVKR